MSMARRKNAKFYLDLRNPTDINESKCLSCGIEAMVLFRAECDGEAWAMIRRDGKDENEAREIELIGR